VRAHLTSSLRGATTKSELENVVKFSVSRHTWQHRAPIKVEFGVKEKTTYGLLSHAKLSHDHTQYLSFK